MGLIGNRTILHKLPLSQIGGLFASDIKTIDNWHCKENANELTNVPSGYYKGWVLPQFAGKISSYKNVNGSTALDIDLFKGLNVTSDILNNSNLTTIGTLIASVLSNTTSSSSLQVGLEAILNAQITLVNTSDLYSTLSAIANLLSDILNTSNLSADNESIGYMSSDISNTSVLSPESIAIAVWNKLLVGTYTAQECVDILTAVAAGKTTINTTSPGNATVKFRDLTDTVDKVEAEMNDSERTNINIV